MFVKLTRWDGTPFYVVPDEIASLSIADLLTTNHKLPGGRHDFDGHNTTVTIVMQKGNPMGFDVRESPTEILELIA